MPPLLGPRAAFHVYERPNACPRAFVVQGIAVRESDSEVVDAMIEPAFAPRKQILLLRSDAEKLDLEARRPGKPAEAEVRFKLDEASHVVLEVRRSGGGFLLLADSLMSGWKAAVDGRPVPLLRADLCFRAVRVPEGDCVVDFRYTPPGLMPGFVLSGSALAVFALLLAFGVRRRADHASRLG